MTQEIRSMLKERQANYGTFSDNAKLSQELKNLWRASPSCSKLKIEATKSTVFVINESMDMVLLKIARLMNGSATHIDSWQDIIGYACLVVDSLKGHQVKEGEKET